MPRFALSFLAAIFAIATCARPVRSMPRHIGTDHPTNATTVLGVEFPPKFNQAQWAEREAKIEAMRQEVNAFDKRIEDAWYAGLSLEQRKALRDQNATNELNMALYAAKVAQREAEHAWFTNRLAYVTKTVKVGKRRIERFYTDGCTWKGSQAVKSTVTTAERGRIVVEILYTADGKKHRVQPIAASKENK